MERKEVCGRDKDLAEVTEIRLRDNKYYLEVVGSAGRSLFVLARSDLEE
jgi:hypothetical protein